MINVIAWGLGSIIIMIFVETLIAPRQRRLPEPLTVLACGLTGMLFFIIMLYATGALS